VGGGAPGQLVRAGLVPAWPLRASPEHPRSVYIREELIVPTLDRWLLGAFSPTALPQTIQAMVEAQDEPDDDLHARAAEAWRVVADCDQRLARYRAALEAGTDPALIARWTAEVNAIRVAAEAQLRTATHGGTRLTADEINGIVTALGSILDVVGLCCPILLCGESEPAQVGCASSSEWCVGRPCVEADEVDGGGGEGVFKVDFAEPGVSSAADPGDRDDLMDGAFDSGAGAVGLLPGVGGLLGAGVAQCLV
jgi:hypothetical protein